MAPVFAYATKWQEGNEYAYERKGVIPPAESFYTKLMQFVVMLVVMAFMMELALT